MFLKSARFWKIFLVRFLGYFFIFLGLIFIILLIEPVVGEEIKYFFNQLSNRHFILPRVVTSAGENQNGFGSLSWGGQEFIVPASTDFGIVIEKINANAKVVENVDPAKEKEYVQALQEGVAHAKRTALPGQTGNIYLFSHSADAPWNIVRFNAIFYLLGKLEKGDRIIIFYRGRRYDYFVFDKVVVGAKDTSLLTQTYHESILTLQTCDPPGTTLNRLIIRARLAGE
jgi:sortase A